MKEKKCLVTAELDNNKLSQRFPNIQFDFDGYNINHEVLDREILKSKIAGVNYLICEYDTIDKEILDCAGKLELIICCRGGVSSVIDLAYAKQKSIRVCNTPGRNAGALAELVMGMILNMSRNILVTNELIHNGKIFSVDESKPKEYRDTVWGLNNDSPFIKYRGKSLNNMSIGIVGYGHTGRAVAEMCHKFDMKILVYSPHVEQKILQEYIEIVDFETLLKKSDIVSLHASVNKENKNMLNEETFSKMKKGAFFINTSRGELVDEDALVKYLNNDWLAGAGLDVTKIEPITQDSILLTAKNLILTPHIAGSASDVQHQGLQIINETLTKFFNKLPIENEVII